MRKCNLIRTLSLLLVLALVLACLPALAPKAQAAGREVRVTTGLELMQAMRYAQPGDEIIVAPGTYVGGKGTGSNGSGFGNAWFYSDVDGTAENPITLRCEDPSNRPTLQGAQTTNGMTLYLIGDYWIVDGLDINGGQKGVMLDNSNHTTIRNCDIHDVTMEGLHLRDGSSYCLVENCKVYNTGLTSKGMGEGIYVGSDKGKWSTLNKDCNYNVIRSCELGPNVDSEHVDIKEGTVGTIVEYCTMHGTGVSGGNYADSFIDAKGNDAIIRYNTCYQEGNDIIVDAFQTHNQIDNWGNGNIFIYNTLVMTNPSAYIVNGHPNVETLAYGNTCNQANSGNKGNVKELTKEEADKYAGEGPSKPDDPQPPVTGDSTVKIDEIKSDSLGKRVVYSVSGPDSEIVSSGLLFCSGSADGNFTIGQAGTYAFYSSELGLISSADSNSDTTGGTLADGNNRKIAYMMVSSAENSSLDYANQYSYIEDIDDGRGYTAGIIGFCSGTGDMLEVVQEYVRMKPQNNILEKYLPALRQVNGSSSHNGLDPDFPKDWETACKDTEMIQAQEKMLDEMYMKPALADAKTDGLSLLGQFIYYDAMVMHGEGDDEESFGGIRAAALAEATPPSKGGDEATYLKTFLDCRSVIMKREDAHDDLSRIVAQQKFINEKKFGLELPLAWTMYGDDFEITSASLPQPVASSTQVYSMTLMLNCAEPILVRPFALTKTGSYIYGEASEFTA